MAKRLRAGLVNFVSAVSYRTRLSLTAAFTQPGRSLLAEPCTWKFIIEMNTHASMEMEEIISFVNLVTLREKNKRTSSQRKLPMIGNHGTECFVEKFLINFPHIVENIFFFLDYETYKTCKYVNAQWRDLLISKRYITKARSVFMWEIFIDELSLFIAVSRGDTDKVERLFESGMLNNINVKSTGM